MIRVLASLFSLVIVQMVHANPIDSYESQQCWIDSVNQDPVVSGGDFIFQGIWNDPHVMRNGGGYVMYMTSSVNEPFEAPILPFRAESTDGVNWSLNPVTPLLQVTGTPFVSIETPSVVYFNERYHMYYTGVYPEGHSPTMAIGHAESDDGINWHSDAGPVLEATGDPNDWNGYLIAEPGAVVKGDQVYLYFTAMGARASGNPPQVQTIGLAISDNGRTFLNQQKIHGQSQLYTPENGFVGYSTPSALFHAGNVHLFYDVATFTAGGEPEWQQVALHHAVSNNGVTFIEDLKPMLTRNVLWWTSGEILAPSAIIDDTGVKMWFAGHVGYSELLPFIQRGYQGDEFGIGYVYSQQLTCN